MRSGHADHIGQLGGLTVRIQDFASEMERIAPPELAMDFDNVGLLISPARNEIRRVLVALDCTVAVAEEAARLGVDLVLTHHPVMLFGVKRILRDHPDTAAVYRLIQNGIGLYAAHTNLDAAAGGVNDAIAERLGLTDVRPLPPENLGRIGALSTSMTLQAFAHMAEQALDCTALATGEADAQVQTVALVGGSGGSDIMAAAQAGADVFVTGECKHHEALAAREMGLCVLTCGHYETERVVLDKLISRLQTLKNDVQYTVTLAETAPQKRLT